ncbi:long-chain fatty acid--CoA ligase (plasmid) [Streptomyces sp. NBC_01591]|uniref:long-chain-fatty-acid--CoA ligase n=1 Tax=Streptomyces sp. NBC_01591 TaxID=2975888 RepID=UPI002DDC2082|nr:long-chain fatty acid--CoA ligase [Streptomyces sp. NBC_01591]WSD74092.1 long-chain fatty acid--CoA ligase [Streptomyces sp. NBC_01591]
MTGSMASILADSAARRPAHPAVVYGSEQFSYVQLWDRARRYAATLREQGVGPGDKVSLLLASSPEYAALYFAVLALGAVVVPINPLLRPAEIDHVLRDSGSRALVFAGALSAETARSAKEAGAYLLTVGDTHPEAVRIGEAAKPVDTFVERAPGDLAAILYTSGTTGRPKGVLLTHGNLVSNIRSAAVAPFAFDGGDVLLCALPLSHSFGQICCMAVSFHVGATMVVMPRFVAGEALRLMRVHGCTVFMGVPTMYYTLLDEVANGAESPRLSRVYSGGAALPVPVLERVRTMFGCEVYEGYGLSETSPVVAYNMPGIPCKPGTVGLPIEGVEVGIADAEVEGRIKFVRQGEVGEVVVRGPNVMAGYLNRPKETAEVLVDGWFRTGDLGMQDADGYLSIVDRKKDMIIRSGYSVYPREVEETLLGHPAVAGVSVVGVPSEKFGEEVCAVVVVGADYTPGDDLASDIMAWSRKRMAAYKYPRRVEFVETFPQGASGKILKRELASRYA